MYFFVGLKPYYVSLHREGRDKVVVPFPDSSKDFKKVFKRCSNREFLKAVRIGDPYNKAIREWVIEGSSL